MKLLPFALLAICLLGCSDHPKLSSQDLDYVQTTVDLLRTRANFIPAQDSLSIKRSLDSIYRKHHTSAAEYQAQTLALSNDPKQAEAIFNAINDSISKKDSVAKK